MRTTQRELRKYCLSFVLTVLFCAPSTTAFESGQSGPLLSREGQVFKLDDIEISLFGIRVANALESDDVAQRLIDHLDEMKSYGIQSVNVSLQGARTGTANAFASNGALRQSYSDRLRAILDATADRGFVCVVTFYYQARDQDLQDDEAVRAATRNATELLKPWRHVWLYVINEPGHAGFDRSILTSSAGRAELYAIIKGIDPDRITYVDGSSNDGFDAHTSTRSSGGDVAVEYVRQDDYSSPGQFTDIQRSEAQADAQATFNSGGYWFWHAAWHQKADADEFPRFDKGGEGTPSDPGGAFVWDRMRDLTF